MPFTDTSRNIRLDGTTLIADCKTADGKYKSSSISLDTLVGNVDGSLRWGYKGFAQTSRNIRLEGSQLSAELKGSDGKWTAFKLDLNSHIHNNKGVLEGVNIHRSATPKPGRTSSPSVDLKLTDSPSKLKISGNGVYGASAIASAASQSSIATSASSSMFSSQSMSSSTSYESHATTKFAESTFRSHSMQMSIRTTCKNLVLEGSILWADCLLMDGVTIQRSSIDLDQYIGFVDGALVFGATGFSKHQSLRNIRLEGFILIAECLTEGLGERWVEIRLDLGEKFKNKNGILIAITLNADLSVMLSEVPWMKFKVIAEPDMSVFARHPVMQETMIRIAESTVEHVTVQMSSMITAAIQSAVSVVTASAMRHISESMEVMVQDVVGFQGKAHASATASGELRMSAGFRGELNGGAYIGGGVRGGGAVIGGGGAVIGGGGYAYGGGSYSASASELQLSGGALLTSSSGTLSSASESHEDFFASNSVKAGGKVVTPGRFNQVLEVDSSA